MHSRSEKLIYLSSESFSGGELLTSDKPINVVTMRKEVLGHCFPHPGSLRGPILVKILELRFNLRSVALLVMLVLFALCSGQALVWAAARDDVTISNEYIAITVNGSEENTGRFSVNTTGGDPGRPDDDYKPLVYGQSRPWTSYTTLALDGRYFVFGGPTVKRSGQGVPTGTWVSGPEVVDNTVQTTYRYGSIFVTQILGFARSLTTGLMDTAQIEYVIKNQDSVEHEVGLRIVLDTMLGANDGAPFRVQEQAVLSDHLYAGDEVPQFWQAFDSLSDPQVMAQGTLRGAAGNSPDRVYFSNWGSLADAPWDFDFQPGRDFTRKGEFELDSALALFWDPVKLLPGQELRCVTYYGMGGITIAPGKLSLGVTAPAEIVANPKKPSTFEVIAYIENSGEGEALDVSASINLPKGYEVVEGSRVRSVGNIPSDGSTQVRWRIAAVNAELGTADIVVRVEAKNSEPNQVRRGIKVVAPASLKVDVWSDQVSINEEKWAPGAFKVRSRITNQGGAAAEAVFASFAAPIGMKLARGEAEDKFLGVISPGESKEVAWNLVPTGVAGNSIPYTIRVRAVDIDPLTVNGTVAIPKAQSAVWWEWTAGNPLVGEVITGQLRVANIKDFAGGDFRIEFDPNILQVTGGKLGVAKGSLIRFDSQGNVATNDWTHLTVDNQRGYIEGSITLRNQWPLAQGDWIEVGFRVKSAGSSLLALSSVRINSPSASEIVFRREDQLVTK